MQGNCNRDQISATALSLPSVFVLFSVTATLGAAASFESKRFVLKRKKTQGPPKDQVAVYQEPLDMLTEFLWNKLYLCRKVTRLPRHAP